MLKLPQVRKELDEDTLASYIIEEECTLAAEGRNDQFLPQANQVLTKKGKPQFQQTSFPSPPTTAQQQQPKNGGGLGGGGEKWKGGKDGQPKGGKGGFKVKCYVWGQIGHVAKYCQQRADKEADTGGEGSGGSSGKGGDGSKGSGQSSCAMVKPQEHGGRSMPYEPLPSLFPITLEEAEEEEEVVAPPAMPYVPTLVPTPPPPSVYPRVIPPAPPFSSSPPLASPPQLVIPSPLPPSIPPAPAPPSSLSSTAPPVGEGGMEVPPSVEITDGQRLETEQLQDESSMDGVQQSGGQETGEQQTGEQEIGEQQTGEQQIGEQQIGEQEMWGIRDGGRVLVSGTTTAPLRRSTRITRGVPPVRYAWAVVVEPAGLDDKEEDEEWTNRDPDVAADPER
ncbi:unnamed protein product [Closterium sp. NIES-65]|nr:unnamed protein product [Closterium sp. NIES-65]